MMDECDEYKDNSYRTAVWRQTTVTDHLKSKQLLLFAFVAENRTNSHIIIVY